LSRIDRRLIEPIETGQDSDDPRLAFQHTVLCQTSWPYRDPGDDVREGLDPTVVSPAAKSLPGRFSSGSRQGTGRTFDEWRVLPKVTAPRYGVLRVRPTESSPVQRAKCQKCCLKGVFSLPQAMLWGRFPIWRLVTRLLGLGLVLRQASLPIAARV
jgi:hypothetical protein